jgi:hypothetical protein
MNVQLPAGQCRGYKIDEKRHVIIDNGNAHAAPGSLPGYGLHHDCWNAWLGCAQSCAETRQRTISRPHQSQRFHLATRPVPVPRRAGRSRSRCQDQYHPVSCGSCVGSAVTPLVTAKNGKRKSAQHADEHRDPPQFGPRLAGELFRERHARRTYGHRSTAIPSMHGAHAISRLRVSGAHSWQATPAMIRTIMQKPKAL